MMVGDKRLPATRADVEFGLLLRQIPLLIARADELAFNIKSARAGHPIEESRRNLLLRIHLVGKLTCGDFQVATVDEMSTERLDQFGREVLCQGRPVWLLADHRSCALSKSNISHTSSALSCARSLIRRSSPKISNVTKRLAFVYARAL